MREGDIDPTKPLFGTLKWAAVLGEGVLGGRLYMYILDLPLPG